MNVIHKKFLIELLKQRFGSNQTIFRLKKKCLNKGTFITVTGISGIFALVTPNDFSTNFSAGIRFLRSLKIGLMISIDYYFSMLGLDENSSNFQPMMGRIHKRAAERILQGCLQNGGTYIKLGQGLVSMSHILPKEYIDTLTTLQDKCLLRSSRELFNIMRQDFGKCPEEMYQCIDMKPIAAASLAQVFDAKTLDGQRVAIKVQYIDLQSRFVSDVATIDFLLKLIGFLHTDFNFGWVLDDLSGSLRQELDFENEGRNSERCARDLKRFSYIYVPKVRWDLTSSRVLVTEFIDGIKINKVEDLQNEGLSLTDIDRKVIEAFGHQIFQTGFVHADPHPGNILIRKKKKEAEIVLLDHGLYQELDENTMTSLSHLWKAIVIQDYEKMKLYSEKLGVKDFEIFAEILTQRPLRSRGFQLTTKLTEEEINYMTEAARDRFDKIMTVLKIMPRSLLLIIRNLNTIRSIAHDHGDPVDRYTLLARSATKTAFKKKNFISKVRGVPTVIRFEIKIITGKIWVWFVKSFLKILTILGRSPDTSLLMKDIN